MANIETHKCCYCGKVFTGWGNNPDCWDGKKWDVTDRCCDDCNMSVVIPNRLKIHKRNTMTENKMNNRRYLVVWFDDVVYRIVAYTPDKANFIEMITDYIDVVTDNYDYNIEVDDYEDFLKENNLTEAPESELEYYSI